ncbi:MAG: hypothetical protein Q7J27_11090 [Syntrophales bacterium]|nr:hypothetical protein [Syntrophales bacterium]
MKEKKGAESTIAGIIIPIDWDDYDDVTRVAIQTSEEEEYFVDQTKKGKELLDFIEEEVEVTGSVREDEDGNFIIEVNEYGLI